MSVPEVPGVMLLCLDVQAPFLNALPDADRLLRRACFTVAAARGLGIRVAFTEQVPDKLGGTAPELLALAADSSRLAKSSFSALADDAVAQALRSANVEHLLLCGLETPICVYQTAIDAVNADLQVTVLSDAVGARRADDATAALAALARSGVHVLPSESVFYALIRDARHPFFKRFTELVKRHG